MSAQRFLDDLARTLAEPMSRRRAVQVVGVTLVTAAVPGVRPRVARAQSGTCVKATCGEDQRCCQKFTAAGTETYCCPRPSWQFQCGSQSNGYRCINVCTGKNSFPCTALIAHPESGINGVCCDRRIHSGCAPIGRPSEKRPDGSRTPSEEWKPSCCPKGPGFGFCGGVCCEPPNRCRDGVCRCPDGTMSIDGRRCCGRDKVPMLCYEGGAGAAFSKEEWFEQMTPIGKTCCPKGYWGCCGRTCCKGKAGCCGDKCCPYPENMCASWKGKKTCCPKRRVTAVRNEQICCPSGTISITLGSAACCPPSDPKCCGWYDGPQVECGPNQVCVRGSCVTV